MNPTPEPSPESETPYTDSNAFYFNTDHSVTYNHNGGYVGRDVCEILERRALAAEARAAVLARALEEAGKMVQRLANVGKFRGLLLIVGVMKSPVMWAQECVGECLKALAPEAQP